VFNNQWDLVALHHAGWAEPDGGATNEGMRISSIVEFLTQQSEDESWGSEMALLLECVQDCADSNVDGGWSSGGAVGRTNGQHSAGKNKGKQVTLNLNGKVDEITINFD
jgi:hypothetical protein